MLQHAALNCFWSLGVGVLSRVALSRGIASPPSQLVELITRLLVSILGHISDDQMRGLLSLRNVAPPDPIPAIVSKEDLEEACTKDEKQDMQEVCEF